VSPLRNTARACGATLAVTLAALPLAACGRQEDDLSKGKALFVQKCGSCHQLQRAGTQGTTGPSLDAAFRAALQAGESRDTVKGVVHRQIANVRRNSVMPANLVTGADARDVAAYVAYATGRSGEDTGALAQAGLSGATTGDQIFTAAGCAGCHKLAKAGANGNIGPGLDQLAAAAGKREPGTSAPDYVHQSIVDPTAYTVSGFGKGVMPSYKGKLTAQQLDALVKYLLGR
jgi:mono/diheme cytochrome c family protein